MHSFTSHDLQKQTGDIQSAATREPVLITHHGKPRAVMMSVEEYRRLKERAGEAVPAALIPRKRGVTVRAEDDPLGYDVSDLDAAVRRMVEDVRSGRTADAVEAELAGVRRRFAKLEHAR
jgi:prevent-host-death family protein